jgi:DNA-binding FrmR family transcriptional regulator
MDDTYALGAHESGTLKGVSTIKSTIPMASKSPASTGETHSSVSIYRADHQKDVVNRLRRIEGQVRGLVEMIQSGRPCEDVALQMSAARKAMDKAFYRMMACSVIEAVYDAENDTQAIAEVEKSARLLEKFG